MLNADFDLTGIEMLDLGTTGVNSTTNLSENDDSINKGMQDHEENAQCDENTEQHIIITKRLDILTQQFERYRNETSIILNELVNTYENQKSPAEVEQLNQENESLKEANKAL